MLYVIVSSIASNFSHLRINECCPMSLKLDDRTVLDLKNGEPAFQTQRNVEKALVTEEGMLHSILDDQFPGAMTEWVERISLLWVGIPPCHGCLCSFYELSCC